MIRQVPDLPEAAFQYNTIVRADHRGHRLGMLVKADNLRTLVEAYPRVRRLHTWNAGENRHMLAINEAMGFEVASVEGAWQRKLVAGTAEPHVARLERVPAAVAGTPAAVHRAGAR